MRRFGALDADRVGANRLYTKHTKRAKQNVLFALNDSDQNQKERGSNCMGCRVLDVAFMFTFVTPIFPYTHNPYDLHLALQHPISANHEKRLRSNADAMCVKKGGETHG